MMFLHCPRCRLAIRYRASYMTMTNCPRCLARAGIVSPMFKSSLNARELRDDGTARTTGVPPPQAPPPSAPGEPMIDHGG